MTSSLNWPELPKWQPLELQEIAKTQSINYLKKIRNINEVLTEIKANKADVITPLEWITFLYNKEKWDEKYPHLAEQTSILIWQVAIENLFLEQFLLKILLSRLVLYYGNNQKILPLSMVKGFFKTANKLKIKKPLTVEIINVISGNNHPERNLSKLGCQYLALPEELFKQENFPVCIEITQKSLNYVVQEFSNLIMPNEQQVKWLLRCLNRMRREQQINAVNDILELIPTEIGSQFPQLVDWLRSTCGTVEMHNRLSVKARRALKDWIGAVNYSDFQKLAELVLAQLPPQNWQTNQLRSRQQFWSCYSNQFERIRILLPQESLKIVGNQLNQDVELLEADGSDPTEVCIFDFGEWLIVEFFRGEGGEMRLFPSHNNRLFEESKLSVKKIRRLGGEIHDHKYVWQYFCKQWLLEKNIHPNPGASPGRKPTDLQLRERQRKLVRWREEIERLERQARRID